MKTHANNTAFPITLPFDGQNSGLTIREYFAAKAMQGICSRISFPATHSISEPEARVVAANCICLANALIAELNKEKE